VHEVLWRKESETMDSTTLVGQDAARASYKIENIRWTQYFTNDGQAIHENFWRDPALFGIPSSHGCLGMSSQDALWFWLWAGVGTPMSIHY
jgi:lipoprotein-anchoring transpeptidase ErfK/SrfK